VQAELFDGELGFGDPPRNVLQRRGGDADEFVRMFSVRERSLGYTRG